MKVTTMAMTIDPGLASSKVEENDFEPPSLTSRSGLSSPMKRLTPSRWTDSDIAAVLAAYGLCVVGMWSVHGGLTELSSGWAQAWTSITSLSGLLTSAVALLALVLVGRPLSLERRFGLDRMFVWHRILGDSMGLLLAIHVGAGTIAWAADLGWINAVIELTGRTPYMALAFIGALLFGVVTITSLKSIRQKFSYETWYFIHMLAYIGLAVSFGHEIYLGSDLARDNVARWFWVGLHISVVALMLFSRWGRTIKAVLRPLRITSIETVGHKTVAIEVSGKSLQHREGDAGQFCFVRPLKRGLWWQSHPFSMSAAPAKDRIRFTIKDRGEATHSITKLVQGTRVIVEGPFGVVTPDVLEGLKALFVVGGVGVAPVLAMVQRLIPDHEPIVLYRAHSEKDLVHFEELKTAVERLGGKILTLTGPTAKLAVKDPFSAKVLTAAIPDVAQRAVVLCGPDRLLHAARTGLKAAGVPVARIHSEHVWW